MINEGFHQIPFANLSLEYSENQLVKSIIERHLKIIINEVRDSIDDQFLSAIICLGSIARGEPALRMNNKTNQIQIISDYDLLVVFNRGLSNKARKTLRELSDELGNELKRMGGFSSKVHLQPISSSYLRRLPSIIAYADAFQVGIVIYSREQSPVLMSRIFPADVRQFEMLELLFNRMEEYLIKRKSDEFEARMFALSKIALDMITIVRLFEGELERTYSARIDALPGDMQDKIPPFILESLKRYGLLMMKFRSGMESMSSAEFETLTSDFLHIENEILRIALEFCRYMLTGSFESENETSYSPFTLNEFKEASSSYVLKSFAPLKFTYVSLRMALRRDIKILNFLTLSTHPVHPKIWLNLGIIAWASFILTKDESWRMILSDYIMKLEKTADYNNGSFEIVVDRLWQATNRYIMKP